MKELIHNTTVFHSQYAIANWADSFNQKEVVLILTLNNSINISMSASTENTISIIVALRFNFWLIKL